MLRATGLVVITVLVSGAISSYSDVDPNSLKCDAKGEVFLLLPHYTHCAKFYQCANGNEIEMICAPGTIFDFANQICNWPTVTKCILRKNSTSEHSSIDESSGWNVEIVELDYSEESSEDNDQQAAYNTTVSDGGGELIQLDSGEIHQHLDRIKCWKRRRTSRIVAYRGDCTRYWICKHGRAESKTCSDGLYYNPTTQQCDYEANVKCEWEPAEELLTEFIKT